jgi:hypothetical protein
VLRRWVRGLLGAVAAFFRDFLKILAILPICRFKTAARFGKIVDILMTRTGGLSF